MRVGKGCCYPAERVEGRGGLRIPNLHPLPRELRALPPGRARALERAACWNNEAERAGPGGSVVDLSNPGEGMPAWEYPSAAVLVLIWGLGGECGRKRSKVVVSSRGSTPPGTPFRPALRVALFFGFTFWRYWTHDSAPGRGEGGGEAGPSGFTPRVGGRRSRRRRRENAVMREKSRPHPLCCSRLGSGRIVWADWASFSALSSRFLPVTVLAPLPS